MNRPSPDLPFGSVAPRPALAASSLILACLCGVLYLTGNGQVSLWDRDEPRYAEASREMVRSGDYIVPRFNGAVRSQKPVLVYWMMSLGVRGFGDNPFGARFGSAVCGMGTCLLTCAVATRMFDPATGLLAGLILAVSPIMVVESKLCTTDALLAFGVAAGLSVLWRIHPAGSPRSVVQGPAAGAAGAQEPDPPPRTAGWAVVLWVVLGLAVLVKGPVAIALVGGVLAVWALLGPGRSAVRRIGWPWGPAVMLAVVLPWCAAIYGQVGWEFYREALGRQLIHRIGQPMEGHWGWPGYYLSLSLGMFFPWSLFVPLALARWGRRFRTDPRASFALAWAVGPLVVLEPVRTKLIHYYLPAYPGWAILTAAFLMPLIRSGKRIRGARLGRFAVSGMALSGLAVAGVVLVRGVDPLPRPLHPALLASSLTLAGGTVAAAVLLACGRNAGGVAVAGGSLAAGFLLIYGWLLPRAEPYRMTHRLAERLHVVARAEGVSARPAAPGRIALQNFREPSLVYYLGGPVPVLENLDLLERFIAAHGPVICPLGPAERLALAGNPRFHLEVRDRMTGFNLDKGRPETLEITRIGLPGVTGERIGLSNSRDRR